MNGTNKSEKKVLEEWRIRSTKLSNSLKSYEQRVQKPLKIPQEGADSISVVVSENGDSSVQDHWQSLLAKNTQELSRAVEMMRGLLKRKAHARGTVESMKGALSNFGKRKGKKRRKFYLESFVGQMEDHKNLMEAVMNNNAVAEDLLRRGHEMFEQKDIARDNAERIMGETETLDHRWNALNAELVKKGTSLKLLANKIDEAYKHFATWEEECQAMDKWLKGRERDSKQVRGKRGDMKKWRSLQNDNQALRKQTQEYKPRAVAVISKSEELLDKNLLDHTDVEILEKTRSSLWSRWQRLNSHVLQRNDRLSVLIKDATADDSRATRRRDSEEIDVKITPEEKRFLETVEKVRAELKNSSDEKKAMLQDEAFNLFTTALDEREKAQIDYDEKSMNSFSAVGVNVSEVLQQIREMQVFEEGLNYEEHRVVRLSNKLTEAQAFDVIQASDGQSLSRRADEILSKWSEQRRQDIANRNRLLQAMLTHCGEWIGAVNANLDELEDLIAFIYISTDSPLNVIQEQHARHEEVTVELKTVDESCEITIKDVNVFLSQELIDQETSAAVEGEISAIDERLKDIHQKCLDNQTRFNSVINSKTEKERFDAISLLSETSSLASFDLRMDYLFPGGLKTANVVELGTQRKGRLPGRKGFLDDLNVQLENKKQRTSEEKARFEKDLEGSFAHSLSECENAIHDLEQEASTTFSEPGVTISDVLQHTVDIQSFEEDMRGEEQKFSRIKTKLNEASGTGLLGAAKSAPLIERSKNLTTTWERQWRLHNENKTKLVKVMGTHSEGWMDQIHKKLDSLEEMANFIEVRRGGPSYIEVRRGDPSYLQEELQRQKELSREIDNMDSTARTVTQFSKDPLLTSMSDRDTEEFISRQANAINAKMSSLHAKAKKNERRLQKALTKQNQQHKTKAQRRLNPDEGFVEADDESFSLKTEKFHTDIDSLVEWMDETVSLIKSLCVDMDPNLASTVQADIEIKNKESGEKEAQVHELNKTGEELQERTEDVQEREIIADKIADMNLKWSQTKSMLDSTAENDGSEPYDDGSADCCLGRLLRKRLIAWKYI